MAFYNLFAANVARSVTADNAFHSSRRQGLSATLRAADAATSPTLTAPSFQPIVLIGQNGKVRRSGAFLPFNAIN